VSVLFTDGDYFAAPFIPSTSRQHLLLVQPHRSTTPSGCTSEGSRGAADGGACTDAPPTSSHAESTTVAGSATAAPGNGPSSDIARTAGIKARSSSGKFT